jgi:hypothetical protein
MIAHHPCPSTTTKKKTVDTLLSLAKVTAIQIINDDTTLTGTKCFTVFCA